MSTPLSYVPGNSTFSILNNTVAYPTGVSGTFWSVAMSQSVPSCGLVYFLYGSDVYIAAWGIYSGSSTILFQDIRKTNTYNSLTVKSAGWNIIEFYVSSSCQMDLTIKRLDFVTGPPFTTQPERSGFKNGYTVFGYKCPYNGNVLYIPTLYNTSGWIMGVSTSISNNSKWMYFVVSFSNESGNVDQYHFITSYNVGGSSFYGNVTVVGGNPGAEWAICFVSSGT